MSSPAFGSLVAASSCILFASPDVSRFGSKLCPFGNQSLPEYARPASFQASSSFHGCMIDIDAPPSNRGLNSLALPSRFPRPLDHTAFLCCRRVGLLPLIELSGGRRMEFSPFQNSGSLEWVPQSQVVCSQCEALCPTFVFDCSCETRWMWCGPPARTAINFFLCPLWAVCMGGVSPITPPGSGPQFWLFC